MGQNWCNRCSKYHNTPVGRNFKRKLPKITHEIAPARTVDIQIVKEAPAALVDDMANVGVTGRVSDDPEIIIDAPAGETEPTLTVEERLGGIDLLMNRLSNKLLASPEENRSRHRRHRSPSWSSSESEDGAARRSRHHRKSPSKSAFSYETLFGDEEIPVKNFEGVIYALFITIEGFIDDGKDVAGLVSHGRFLAEKAIADAYTPDTFVQFDRFVRAKASKKGFQAFDSISELEKSRFFNLENHKEVKALKAKASKQGNRKSGGICRRFNGDLGCFARTCHYAHRCDRCGDPGHPAKDCSAAKTDKTKK